MDAIQIGQFIATVRKEKGMTQADLAESLNVTTQAVSRWERGKGLPQINIIAPLANVLEVTTAEILSAQRIDHSETILNEKEIERIFLGYMRTYERDRKEGIQKVIRRVVVTLVSVVALLAILVTATHNINIPIKFGGKGYQTMSIKRESNGYVYLHQKTYPSQQLQCKTVTDDDTGRMMVFISGQVSIWDYLFGTPNRKMNILIAGNSSDSSGQVEFETMYYCAMDISALTPENYADYVQDTRTEVFWEHR